MSRLGAFGFGAGRVARAAVPASSPPPEDDFPNIPAPAGALGFTTLGFAAQVGSTHRLAYLSTSTQLYPETELYAYRYKFANPSDETLFIGSLQAGPWYYRIADVLPDGETVGDLSHEIGPVTAS